MAKNPIQLTSLRLLKIASARHEPDELSRPLRQRAAVPRGADESALAQGVSLPRVRSHGPLSPQGP